MTSLGARASSGGIDNLLVNPFNLSHTHTSFFFVCILLSLFPTSLSRACLCVNVHTCAADSNFIVGETAITNHPFTSLLSPSLRKINVCEYYITLVSKSFFLHLLSFLYLPLRHNKNVASGDTGASAKCLCQKNISIIAILVGAHHLLVSGQQYCWTVDSAPWRESVSCVQFIASAPQWTHTLIHAPLCSPATTPLKVTLYNRIQCNSTSFTE